MNAIDTEVMMMNKIIIEAIEHGEDGGAYFCNARSLREMLEMWLRMKGLDKDYKVSKCHYELIILLGKRMLKAGQKSVTVCGRLSTISLAKIGKSPFKED